MPSVKWHAQNEKTRQLLVDYVYGDPEVALEVAATAALVPETVRNALDIGCGIGWSSAELKRLWPHASVTGEDSLVAAVRVAESLFAEQGLAFRIAGDPYVSRTVATPFDTVVVHGSVGWFLDSVADGTRWSALAATLTDDASIVLALRRGLPCEAADAGAPGAGPNLQDIATGLAMLAQLIGARVTHNPSIGSTRAQQVIAQLQRGDDNPRDALRSTGLDRRSNGGARVENTQLRRARVMNRLGVRVTRDGYLIPNGPGPAVLIVSPNRNAYSESFIKAQIEGLPTRVEVLFGVSADAEDEDGHRLTPRWARALKRAVVAAFGASAGARIDGFWLDRFLKRRSIRVALAVYGPTGAQMMGPCRRNRIPLVTQFLGFDATERAVVEALRSEYPVLLEHEAATIAVSRDIARRLVEMGARPGSVHWLPCGVDANRFDGSKPAENPPVFLAAGRFVEKKAPHLTLLAFSRVLRDAPTARLQMVGGGPLLDACRQLADALEISSAVEFLGFRPHHELGVLMRGARAFVQHSVTAPSGDAEGTPVAILEAGVSGLPVIATRHGGIPDVVIEGVTGFLVDEGDIGEMAERMRRLALDPALAGVLGAQARKHVSDNFELADSLERLWRVLAHTLN